MVLASIVTIVVQCCLLPIFGCLAKAAIAFFNKEKEVMIVGAKNKTVQQAIDLVSDLVVDCVRATNQTYVNALKEQDAFDEDAQAKALEITKNSVLDILTDEIQESLNEVLGDLNVYLTQKIESVVVAVKKVGQK